jgi:hypothetical protein
VDGADFGTMYEVEGVWAWPSEGDGGFEASMGYFELSGASLRLWRLG